MLFNFNSLISILAISLSLCTLVILVVQVRLLRKDVRARSYQELITKLFCARETIIGNPDLGNIFDGHAELDALKKETGLTVQEFFWILEYLTAWENFYYQRKIGVMGKQTWEAYVASVTLILKAPKIKTFWESWRKHGSYMKDWINFVNLVAVGETPPDPVLPKWKRVLWK